MHGGAADERAGHCRGVGQAEEAAHDGARTPAASGPLTCWDVTSARSRRTAAGSLISRTWTRFPVLCTPRSSLICFPALLSAGRSLIICGLILPWTRWRWRSGHAGRHIGDALVHHSDRGVQYTSICYTERLEDIGAVRSVGSKGDSYDNAAAEAVNSLYKKELINFEGPWQGAGDVTVATAEWVSWYNSERLHSACGDIPPAEYEKDWLMGQGNTIMIWKPKHRSLQRTRGGST